MYCKRINIKTGISPRQMHRRRWTLLAAILLAAVACSVDDVITRDTLPVAVVSFRVQSNAPATRAAGAKTSGSSRAAQINALIVNGWMASDDSSRFETLLDGASMFRLKGTENRFDYTPHVYYPSWARIAGFAAYSPVSGRVEGFNIGDLGNDAGNTIAYSLPDPAIEPQEDLLVASTYTKVALNGYVLFNMKHALSRIHVRALNTMIYPVVIHDIILHNLYGSGTLDVDADDWPGGADRANNDTANINEPYVDKPITRDDYKILWKPDGERNLSYRWRLATAGAVIPATMTTEYITSDDQAMLVMPQITQNSGNDACVSQDDIAKKDFYMEIAYTIQNYTTTARLAFTDLNAIPQSSEKEGIVFEMGRQYALTVCFSLDAVTFSVNVGDWYETEIMY